ncbi:MAG: hypothetical protein IKD66_08900, partial [Solobacterium sp.]|nr:hypothetical protein [Solobacterium sp.]
QGAVSFSLNISFLQLQKMKETGSSRTRDESRIPSCPSHSKKNSGLCQSSACRQLCFHQLPLGKGSDGKRNKTVLLSGRYVFSIITLIRSYFRDFMHVLQFQKAIPLFVQAVTIRNGRGEHVLSF